MLNSQIAAISTSPPKTTRPSDTSDLQGRNGFSDVLKMQRVDALMHGTPNFQRWQQIRQNNVALANKLADMLFEYHSLAQKTRQGEIINQSHYNNLTKDLARHGLQFSKVANRKLNHPISPPSPPPFYPATNIDKTAIIAPQNIINDDNLLILDIKLDKFHLQREMIGYGNRGKYFLPLGDLAKALDLHIDVTPKTGKASGWFISKERSFALDAEKNSLNITGQAKPINPAEVQVGPNDIYIDSKALSRWLPADFNVDLPNLSIQVKTREKFPIQERLAREELRKRLERQGHNSKAQFPLAESEYTLFSTPSLDINSNSSFELNDGTPYSSSTNTVRARGDLAFMSSDLFISGDDQEPLKNITWKLERNAPQADLFGPLHATSFAMGDIATAKLPFIQTSIERGITINNKNLAQESEFDTTRFEGNMPPGWDLEIYRNNSLVAATTVDQNGHYEINDVAVYFGKNKFQIIAYGPQGQKKIENKIINVGAEMLKKGKSRYDISLSEQDRKTIELDKTDNTGVTKGDNRLVGKFEYGVNDRLTVSGGGASIELDGQQHNYLNAGLQGAFAGVFGKSDIVLDNKHGIAAQFLVQSSVGPFLLRAKQDFLHDFVEPDSYNNNDKVSSRSDLSLSGTPLKLGPLPAMPYSVSLQHTKREESTETEFTGHLSTRFYNTHISNTITGRNNTNAPEPTTVEGNVYLSRIFGPLSLRGNGYYEVKPDWQMKNYDLNGFFNISPKLSAQVNLSHSVDENGATKGSLSLSWDTGKMLISPNVSYDSNNNLTAVLNLNFSLGREPRTGDIEISSKRRTNSGAISALVFNDKNNNHIFDDSDERIEGAEVKATQARRKEKTNKNGIAILTSLPNFKRSDVEISQESLEDPFWVPSTKGVSIIPRPGEIRRLDFPVVTTGEVDGTVFKREDNGTMSPQRNSEIILYDLNGKEIQRTRSEYDGFYLFEKILPGDYLVKFNQKQGNKDNSYATSTAQVSIGTDGTVINGLDFVIQDSTIIAATKQISPDYTPEPTTNRFSDQGHLFMRRLDGRREQVQDTSDQRPRVRLVTPGVLPPPTPNKVQRDQLNQEGLKLVSVSKIVQGQAPHGHENETGNSQIHLVSRPLAPSQQPGSINKADTSRINLVSRPLTDSRQQNVDQHQDPQVAIKTAFAGYGIQLGSFRFIDNAVSTLNSLQKSLKDLIPPQSLAIVPVDLGPQVGIRYRIVAAGLSSREQTDKLSHTLKKRGHDCIPVHSAIGSEYEIHLASYRNAKSAVIGLQKIQQAQSDLFSGLDLAIRKINLGADKGVWYRVVVDGLNKKEEAVKLSEQLSKREQYNKIFSH